MASLDKTSVRAEVSRLKTDFEQLCAEGNITAESKALMMSLFMIVELILSIFLEKPPKKTTRIPAYPLRKPKKMSPRWTIREVTVRAKMKTIPWLKIPEFTSKLLSLQSVPVMSAQKT